MINKPEFHTYCPFCDSFLKTHMQKTDEFCYAVMCNLCFYEKDKSMSRYEVTLYYPYMAYMQQFIIEDYCIRIIYDKENSCTQIFRLIGCVLSEPLELPFTVFDLKDIPQTLRDIMLYLTFS